MYANTVPHKVFKNTFLLYYGLEKRIQTHIHCVLNTNNLPAAASVVILKIDKKYVLQFIERVNLLKNKLNITNFYLYCFYYFNFFLVFDIS